MIERVYQGFLSFELHESGIFWNLHQPICPPLTFINLQVFSGCPTLTFMYRHSSFNAVLGLEKNALKVNRVIGKPRYRRSILVLKPQIGEYESLNPCFLEFFTYFIFHTILDIISLAKTNLFEQRFESYNPYHMAN